MTFVLGARSRAHLAGVAPPLVRAVELAILITTQDFAVWEGARSLATQKRNIARGVSWTLDSRHLVRPDGFARAVDLVPWVDGKPVWDWPRCHQVAAAMARAARERGVSLIWGGVWDRPMSAYGSSAAQVRSACEAYVARRRAAGKRAVIDGPHFELA